MNFTKENLYSSAGWIQVQIYNGKTYEYKFVARCRNQKHAGPFKTFLKKNFTVEEYFEAYDLGTPPLLILQSKGYISPNMRKVLRKAGYSATPEGNRRYLEAQKELS